MWDNADLQCAVLGSGTMGSQIALSLCLRQSGVTQVTLWGRSQTSLDNAKSRIAEAADFMVQQGLLAPENKQQCLQSIAYTTDMAAATAQADFIIEAVSEDITLKQTILQQAESHASADAVLSSTTSALGAGDIQSVLNHPERFVVAHYAQPAHLVAVVEVIMGKDTDSSVAEKVTQLLNSCGKMPVDCPDIAGFFWARIQHAILRECVSMVERGIMTPADCDNVLKNGYGSRLPAMGSFEHADLAGIDLILSPAAQEVWKDLSNVSDPTQTMMGKMLASGDTGMASGKGFYDWNDKTVEDFKANRDKEIVRRAKINAGGEVKLS